MRIMSPSFLVKILCYTWRPFTLVSSTFICAGHYLILKWLSHLVEWIDVEHVITWCLFQASCVLNIAVSGIDFQISVENPI